MTNEERSTKIREMKEYVSQGRHRTALKTFKQIARDLGVSTPTAQAWLKEFHPEVYQDVRKLNIRRTHPKLQWVDDVDYTPPPLWEIRE